MKRRSNGSVQSTNTPVYNQPGAPQLDTSIYRCMVTGVTYADDSQNIGQNAQNPEVLYEVVILGGYKAGQTMSNCRLASWLGGDDNYSERTLTPTSKDISKSRLADHDGDVVYVQFIQGLDRYPVIIAAGKGLNNKIAATSSTGPRSIEEFNGLVQTIDNSGNWSVVRKGGTLADGRFKPNSSADVSLSLTKGKFTRTWSSGLSIAEDGSGDSVIITTSGGVSATIDGKSQKISLKAGATEVLIDGNTGKISLKGEMIDLGSSVSDFVTMFTALATAFNSHTHMAPQAPTGILPTTPPMAPLLSTVGSQTVKVQS